MRNFYVPHTARWVAVCISIFSGSLIFLGCDGGSSADTSDPYAALDKAFPDGRVELLDCAARAQDPAYVAEITSGTEKFSQLSKVVNDYDAELAHIKNELAQSLSRRMGETIPEELLVDELEKNPLYQQVLAKRNAAAEAAEAQRQANVEAIRKRMSSSAKRYDELLAEADAKAKAAGLPTRAELQAQQAAAEVVQQQEAPKAPQKPVMEAPTLKTLSEKTGIPLPPATDKQ